MRRKLHPYTKICLPIAMTMLMFTCMACGNSPVEEDNQDKEAPDLEKILKDMVLIPAGEFLMGSPDGEGLSNEHPQHRVYLDTYYIDRYEVTNAQFKEFVDATGKDGKFRVLRGGSWANSDSSNARCAVRVPQVPDYSSHFIGFRCVLERV